MTKEQKNEVIEALKEKFSQYNNFYVTNTESLSVEQIVKLRRAWKHHVGRLQLMPALFFAGWRLRNLGVDDRHGACEKQEQP